MTAIERAKAGFQPWALLLAVSIHFAILFPGPAHAGKKPEILTFQESESDIDAVFFSPDGRHIMSAGNGRVKVWDVSSGGLLKIFGPERLSVWSTDPKGFFGPFSVGVPLPYETRFRSLFSPDGTQAFLGIFPLFDRATGTLVGKGGADARDAEQYPVWHRKYISVKSRVFDGFESRRRGYEDTVSRYRIEEKRMPAFCSPDGKYALMGGDLLYNASDGGFVYEHKDGYPGAAAFSPDGKRVLFSNQYRPGTKTYVPYVFDMKSRKKRALEGDGHGAPIEAVAFSPDGRHVVSGSRDYTLKLWNVETAAEIRTYEGHAGPVRVVAFSPDGRHFISGADDNTLRVWDVDSGQEDSIFKPAGAYDGSFVTAVFSPGGRHVITANRRGNITLWNVADAVETVSVESGGRISSAAFSPDGRLLITGHEKGHTKLWATGSLNLIATLSSFDDGEWAVVTPEGYFNASSGGGKHLKVKAGRSVYSIDRFYDRFYNPALVAKKLSGRTTVAGHDIREGVAAPPKVRIVRPRNGETFLQSDMRVVVKAVDNGGGIDEVRLFHNDCAVGGGKRGLKTVTENDVWETAYQVSLVPGENRFKALGFSSDRTESGSHEITLHFSSGEEKIDLYLVTVGINEYANPGMNLNFAVADSEGLKNFFTEKWRHLFHDFHVAAIHNQDATKSNITRVLSGLDAGAQDVVIIFLAGHGLNIGDEWYFLSHDVKYPEKEDDVRQRGISSTEMAAMLTGIPALKKALIIDACKSGGVLSALSRGVEDRRAIARLARSTGTHVIAASTDKQVAAEIPKLGHGLFTYALLRGLNGEAGNRDDTVTVRELISYIEQYLPEMSEKYGQMPQYPVADSRGQDFPLVVLKEK
ncbi:MAG: caspase family protein [Deltaproteobacteria bacterium]|nr:caspase family protein [Deltaproteobacteria bacterium]